MTVGKLHNLCKNKLINIANADFEASQIVLHVLNITKTQFLLNKDTPVNETQIEQCNQMIEKRLGGIPLYYILGKCEFYGLEFYVGEGVLIPRQDTELLVDIALDLIKAKKNPKILDLCSGTGCIAISIAKNIVSSTVTAIELMDTAYNYLLKNIKLNNADNVTAVKADALTFDSGEHYDLIVCNPPYIDISEKSSLQREVLNEPHNALFADEDGLLFYRVILNNLSECIKDGYIAFEIGYNQANAVKSLFLQRGFSNVSVIKDLQKNDRVVIGYNTNLK